jgi:hypothetical protein
MFDVLCICRYFGISRTNPLTALCGEPAHWPLAAQQPVEHDCDETADNAYSASTPSAISRPYHRRNFFPLFVATVAAAAV